VKDWNLCLKVVADRTQAPHSKKLLRRRKIKLKHKVTGAKEEKASFDIEKKFRVLKTFFGHCAIFVIVNKNFEPLSLFQSARVR
jgi:hypothetical protein